MRKHSKPNSCMQAMPSSYPSPLFPGQTREQRCLQRSQAWHNRGMPAAQGPTPVGRLVPPAAADALARQRAICALLVGLVSRRQREMQAKPHSHNVCLYQQAAYAGPCSGITTCAYSGVHDMHFAFSLDWSPWHRRWLACCCPGQCCRARALSMYLLSTAGALAHACVLPPALHQISHASPHQFL